VIRIFALNLNGSEACVRRGEQSDNAPCALLSLHTPAIMLLC
jgi:hypothetical protein